MLRAAFIGINEHGDPRIRSLMGARRDATALWALVSDSIPEAAPMLLTDREATGAAIRRTLDETLGAALPDDTVFVSFSGHGTHDHRLVAHDTTLDDLINTTITMAELAERFRQSRARAVLFILDCCFSGAAPSRVLEASPIPRDPGLPIELLAGKGRVLIAASNIDEPAWEQPGTGHGLLTKAILDILQAVDGPIGLPEVMDRVMQRVRADATALGVVQTPVLFGFVEGGLSLPALRPGERFWAAFPEMRGVRVGSAIEDLAVFRIPETVLAEWSARFGGGLNDLQVQAVNEFRVLDGASLLVVAPTSAGKTFIGEMAATRAILDGRKAVFLLPYQALVNEKYDQFTELYGDRLGMRVIRCTGAYVDQVDAFVRGKYDLALLTYEMFLNIAVGVPALLNQLGLVVLDEAQFITDPGRGVTVELLLTFLRAAREVGIAPQIVALSAVIGAVNDFDTWLGCKALVTHHRPVRLIEGVMDRNGSFQCADETGQPRLQQLLPPGAVRVRREKPSAQDLIVPLVRALVEKGEQVIVFRNQRGPAQGCAAYLGAELGLPPASAALAALPEHDLTSASETLRGCLAAGTAFHNTNLMREERAVVERAFRDPRGGVRVLAATTTVAAGINTPASTVVLAEQEFIGDDGRPFTVAEYKNMAGRAGRLGFGNEEGKAIILADTPHERDMLFHKYVQGQLEPLRSSFEPDQLDTWLVRLLAQVRDLPERDAIRLLANTYGGYLANLRDPSWRPAMEARLIELLQRMAALELVEHEGDRIRLTLIGRACGRSGLSFESAMRLVDLLRRAPEGELDAERLMALLQVLPESDGGYTPLMKRGRAETVRPAQAAERYGSTIARALQRYAQDEFDYYARCKRAAVLWDWVHGRPLNEIETLYSPNPYQGRITHGDVRRFADATRFHLRSAQQIATILLVGHGPDEQAIDRLLRQLEVGLPVAALSLLDLPVPLSRGEYLALHGAGVDTPAEIWALPQGDLQRLLGASRNEQLEHHRPEVKP